jgi:hypothetical protein
MQILNQGGDGTVKEWRPVFHAFENVMVNRMIVPVSDPAAQWSVQGSGDQVNAGLDQAASKQAALAPGVSPVTLAHAIWLQTQVKCPARFRTGQNIPGLFLKSIERALPGTPLSMPGEAVQTVAQAHLFA